MFLSALLAVLSVTSIVSARADESPPPQARQLVIKLSPDTEVDAVLDSYRGTALQGIGDGSVRVLSSTANVVSIGYDDERAALRALGVLQQHSDVLIAELEQGRQLLWEPTSEPDYELQREWVQQVNLPEAWNISTGTDATVVAIVDSGVSPTHPDLAGKLVDGYNAVDDDDNWADIDGHGTHVAGIIAASGSNGQGTVGSAMDAKIMPIRVLDDKDFISTTSIANGIYWAVDHGADVINLSLGAETPSQIEQDAVRYAYDAGIPVLAAAGNRASKISYPASYPESISVGALDSLGNRATFSSVVSTVDFAAPGVLIYSPHWSESTGDGWTNVLKNQPVSGTSFAVAIASGVAALMRSINGDLGPEDVRQLITSTAIDSGDPGNEAGVGAGQMDAEAAVRLVAFEAMYDTWYPADSPVAGAEVQRTWLWGQDPPPYYRYEQYEQAQHNVRLVYYYDKSRMEITNPFDDREATWYVTNGLLVNELVTGRMQVGDGEFIDREPADVNVAGDPDDVLGPTYAAFGDLLDAPPVSENLPISQTISRDGTIGSDALLISYGVVGSHLDETTGHRVANVFWDYLNSSGLIATGDGLVEGPLFDPWFFATGLPITEAYWAKVKVADAVQDVLMQCFERRCLTYTPANPLAWRVEMGNVGLHYFTWRYGEQMEPQPEPPDEPGDEPGDEPTPPVRGEATFTAGFDLLGSATIDEGSRTVVEEGYLIEVNTEGFEIGALVPQLTFSDGIVESTVRILSEDATGAYCVVARREPANGDRYQACIWATGGVSLVYSSAQGDELLVMEENYLEPAQLANGVEVALLSSGSDLWLEVDGELVGHASHEGLTVGSAGLVAVGTGIFLATDFSVYLDE
ncbi:MAG: S8 family serine peptidase [Thermomicrobiales bacterium]